MLSNSYFLMMWVFIMIVEAILLLVVFVRSMIDFFRVRKSGNVILAKKTTVRFVFSLIGLCLLPFMLILLGLMLLSLAPGLKY